MQNFLCEFRIDSVSADATENRSTALFWSVQIGLDRFESVWNSNFESIKLHSNLSDRKYFKKWKTVLASWQSGSGSASVPASIDWHCRFHFHHRHWQSNHLKSYRLETQHLKFKFGRRSTNVTFEMWQSRSKLRIRKVNCSKKLFLYIQSYVFPSASSTANHSSCQDGQVAVNKYPPTTTSDNTGTNDSKKPKTFNFFQLNKAPCKVILKLLTDWRS